MFSHAAAHHPAAKISRIAVCAFRVFDLNRLGGLAVVGKFFEREYGRKTAIARPFLVQVY